MKKKVINTKGGESLTRGGMMTRNAVKWECEGVNLLKRSTRGGGRKDDCKSV